MTPNASDADEYAVSISARHDDPEKPAWLRHLAHDLRNPLSSLHAGMALLRSGKLSTSQQSNLLVTLQRQLDLLTRLVDDTAGLLRPDTGAMQRIRLADVLDTVAERLSGHLDGTGIGFQLPPADSALAVDGSAKALIHLIEWLVLHIAQVIDPGSHIVAAMERSGSTLRLCFVATPATHDAVQEFSRLADSLSLPPEHVADAALQEILRQHRAGIRALRGAETGIALLFPVA